MADRILGFQVVLLDEQGLHGRRIPDVFYDDELIVVDGRFYELWGTAIDDRQRVRYFSPQASALRPVC